MERIVVFELLVPDVDDRQCPVIAEMDGHKDLVDAEEIDLASRPRSHLGVTGITEEGEEEGIKYMYLTGGLARQQLHVEVDELVVQPHPWPQFFDVSISKIDVKSRDEWLVMPFLQAPVKQLRFSFVEWWEAHRLLLSLSSLLQLLCLCRRLLENLAHTPFLRHLGLAKRIRCPIQTCQITVASPEILMRRRAALW